MKVLLEISGKELVLLYIATGNEDAGKILHEAAEAEREFNGDPPRKHRGRRPKSSPLPILDETGEAL
jgi:hypothetical protein